MGWMSGFFVCFFLLFFRFPPASCPLNDKYLQFGLKFVLRKFDLQQSSIPVGILVHHTLGLPTETPPPDRPPPDRDPPRRNIGLGTETPPGRDMGPSSQTGSDIIQTSPTPSGQNDTRF